MQTEERIGQYLRVMKVEISGKKTCDWAVLSNDGSELGVISWYGPWRQYTFDPISGATFNSQCLEDVAAFLKRSQNIRQA